MTNDNENARRKEQAIISLRSPYLRALPEHESHYGWTQNSTLPVIRRSPDMSEQQQVTYLLT